jgi:hypothetical protein
MRRRLAQVLRRVACRLDPPLPLRSQTEENLRDIQRAYSTVGAVNVTGTNAATYYERKEKP